MILKQRSFSKKLGDNIVTVTNNVLHTFLKIFAVVNFFPCLSIIADTVNVRNTFAKLFLPQSVDFFPYINMGTAFQLPYLIKIIKMAAELCKGVLYLTSRNQNYTISL